MQESEIQRVLQELSLLLEHHEVSYWPAYLGDLATRVKAAYESGDHWDRQDVLVELEELYGGMGSLSELTIGREGSDALHAQDVDTADGDLATLCWCLARVLEEMTRNPV